MREKLATRKASCESAPEAKNASVWMPTPMRVTTYHGIRFASTALHIASAASVRLNRINLENRPTEFQLTSGCSPLESLAAPQVNETAGTDNHHYYPERIAQAVQRADVAYYQPERH